MAYEGWRESRHGPVGGGTGQSDLTGVWLSIQSFLRDVCMRDREN